MRRVGFVVDDRGTTVFYFRCEKCGRRIMKTLR